MFVLSCVWPDLSFQFLKVLATDFRASVYAGAWEPAVVWGLKILIFRMNTSENHHVQVKLYSLVAKSVRKQSREEPPTQNRNNGRAHITVRTRVFIPRRRWRPGMGAKHPRET